MPTSGPIVVVEDDMDDQEIIRDVLNEIGTPNKLIFFDRSPDALNYLKTTSERPFIIVSDINLPVLNGLDFKKQIDDDHQLRKKSIPFIFMSTAATKPIVTEAYTAMTVQGFFQKSSSIEKIKEVLTLVIDYWKLCKHPNSEV
jgi:CheY-like chemotaxis protein